MSDKKLEWVYIGDVPPELMEDPVTYSVTLIGIQRKTDCIHCGSGTLVKTGDRHFILTARHCAEPYFRCELIGTPIRRDDHPFIFQKIDPIYVANPDSEEWGPDLAFIPMDPLDVSRLHADSTKTFYNLDLRREEMLQGDPGIGRHLWAVVGTPNDQCVFDTPPVFEFSRETTTLVIEGPIIRGDFDYLEARIPPSALKPGFFEGVSGGGLWHADLKGNPDTSFELITKPRLEGVAFYRTDPDEDGIARIRFHGRKSIYEKALAEIL